MAFIPNPYNLPEVDHIDNDPSNNDVTNLRWISSSGNIQNKPKPPSYRRSVTCLNTMQEFRSITAAADFACTDTTRIIESIASRSQCKRYVFVYTDDMPEDIESYIASAQSKYQSFHRHPIMPNSKKVICLETGQIFDSRAEAARYYSCNCQTITNRINANKSFNGVTLEWYTEDNK